ncbi:MAG: hypothetical protein ABI417_02910 [Coleofasciculaceae cyanobacterium]|jgi:hypothetical protein
MCNYTIAFSHPFYFGGSEWFNSFSCLINQFLADFNRSDEDDNRGSGR